MKNLYKKLYTVIILSLTIVNIIICAEENPNRQIIREQDLLLQRATITPELVRIRSIQLETTRNAQLNTAVIRPRNNLSELVNQIEELERLIKTFKNQKEYIERYQRWTQRDINHIENYISSLQHQAHAMRYRPDRQDIEHQDDGKSCCLLTSEAIKSIINDCFHFQPKKTESVKMKNCKVLVAACPITFSLFACSLLLGLHNINQTKIEQNSIDHEKIIDLKQKIHTCESDFAIAAQVCKSSIKNEYLMYGKHAVWDFVEDDINKKTLQYASLPTSQNHNFAYPVTSYQKPEYLKWQAGKYRQRKQKTE